MAEFCVPQFPDAVKDVVGNVSNTTELSTSMNTEPVALIELSVTGISSNNVLVKGVAQVGKKNCVTP